jgi:hypothetical protein
MAAVHEVSLLQREVRERLGASGLDLLLSEARRLSEGHLAGDGSYFGSTMLTIEIAALAGRIRGARDPDLPRRVAAHLAKDEGALARLRAIALEEARRIVESEAELERVGTDVRVRAEEGVLYIDLDVEAARRERAPVPGAEGPGAARGGEP